MGLRDPVLVSLAALVVLGCSGRAGSNAGAIEAGTDAGEAGASSDGMIPDLPADAVPDVAPDRPGPEDAASEAPPETSSEPSTPVMIGMLPATDPLRPFQHAAEVSVAARGNDVVVSAINIHTDGPDTLAATDLLRQVGVAVSHDWGDTFGATFSPGLTDPETSDPVVRATVDGSIWLAVIGIGPDGNRGLLLRSRDGGRGFDTIHDDLALYDKEWIAASPGGGLILGGEGGLWRFAADGRITAAWADGSFDWTVLGAFDDGEAAYFSTPNVLYSWDGEMGPGAGGAHVFQDHDPSSGWSIPAGRAADGALWAIYGTPPDTESAGITADVRLVLFTSDGDAMGETIAISAPGATAFMPAAAQDDDGHVHLIWYDSGGATGVLKYARSVSADLRDGFMPPMIVDADACPGGRWFPHFGEGAPPPGSDRRLREYADLAITGRRVHMAWTHAPTLPSRILLSHLDF